MLELNGELSFALERQDPVLGISWVGLSSIFLHFLINQMEDHFFSVKCVFVFVNEVENIVFFITI